MDNQDETNLDIKPDVNKESPEHTTSFSMDSLQQNQQQPTTPTNPLPDQQQSSPISSSTANQQNLPCPFCSFTCDSDLKLQQHMQSTHQPEAPPKSPDAPPLLCPLCQDGFKERSTLEKHVMQIHSVNAEGLQRLLMLVDQSHWLNRSNPTPELNDTSANSVNQDEEKCPQCSTIFRTNDELCLHRLETGHLSGNACPKTGCGQSFPHATALMTHFRDAHAINQTPTGALVSERHVYKYRCNQCSLAFKTLDKLTAHSHYHAMRDATRCSKCGRGFRSAGALQRHLETSHCDEENAQQNQIEDLTGENESIEQDMDDPQRLLEDYLNSPALAEEGYNDPNRKHKCHRCRAAFTSQAHLSAHNKSLQHRRGEKLAYPLEKFLDPNRPFKCDVCKESFTQKNILLVHYNSVSHLHKLKRAALQDNNNLPNVNNTQQSPQNQPESIPSPTGNTISSDDEKKPFRCDICRVAYAQGSTLDIHMRSVLHQTRACRLQNPENAQNLSNTSPTPPTVSSPDTLTPSSPNALSTILQETKKGTNPSQQMYKTLLESFGFDLVMQYNEAKNASPPRQETPKEIPNEVGPYTCQHCHKSFSSIFVLKTHCEEVHRDKVPLEFLEQFAEHFKTEYEKKSGIDETSVEQQQESQAQDPLPNADAPAISSQIPPQNAQLNQLTQQQQQNLQQMQLMNEMQAALNVMQFHPMMAQMMSMGLP